MRLEPDLIGPQRAPDLPQSLSARVGGIGQEQRPSNGSSVRIRTVMKRWEAGEQAEGGEEAQHFALYLADRQRRSPYRAAPGRSGHGCSRRAAPRSRFAALPVSFNDRGWLG